MKKTGVNLLRNVAIVLILMLMSSGMAISQITVKGNITDKNNEPLIGVNVRAQGSSSGTITDFNGSYSIEVPGSKSVLVFSYIGYRTVEKAVGQNTTINVVLEEDVHSIDEVVVVGYGVQKKSHLTGSVSKYKDDKLGDLAVSRLDQALQGKIAGVSVQNTTTEAGSAPQIRVRGMGSISASNEPLVVVDGYPVAEGLAFVDMNDVESIEVLKDAASSAIYGSRGANGVILVTTKSGDVAKAKYSVKAYTGFKSVYSLHNLMSANEYVDMLLDEQSKGGTGPSTAELAWKSIDNYTDWQREALRDIAKITNAQFSVSGGKKEAKYYVSGSYTGDEGVMIHSKYDKYNFRAKLDAALSKNVDFGLNLSPSYSRKETPATNFIDFYRTYSWLPVRHTEATAAITGQPVGSYAHGRHFNNKEYTDADGNVFTASPWGTSNNNPRSIMDNESNFTDDYRMTGSAYLNVRLAKGLEFKTSNGYYVQYRENNIYHNANAKSDGDANYAIYTNKLTVDLLSENTLNYSKSIGKHDFTGLLGYTANKVTTKAAGIKGTGFPTDYVQTINAATGITIEETDGTRRTYTMAEEEMLISGLARVTYSYDNKYLFSGSLRGDASSKFGPENQLGWFPSVSLGWRASEEKFIKETGKIDQLKFRASWGVTGNNDITNYAAYDKLQSANYVFGSGSTLNAGLANTSSVLGNKAITWEQSYEYNAGFDLSILKSRINLSLDAYYSITKSLLFEQPAMAISGYTEYWNNIGKVRNQGIEIELNTYNIKKKKFEWQTSFNLSFNNNRLLQLGDGEERLLSYGERSEVYVAKVGAPSIQYYGYKTDGIWLSQEEIDNSGYTFLVGKTVRPGTLKVVDQDGNKIINADDRVELGNPFPKFNWGMTNSFKIDRFDVSVQLQGVQGVTVLNGDGYYSETKKINKAYTTNRFISTAYPGDGKTPTFANGDGMQWELTDYLLQDASYAAIRDVNIGYTFDKKLLRKIKVNTLRLYASGQNLLYVWSSGYKGINPEARSTSGTYSSPLVSGYQRGAFPLQRTFSFGLEVGF
ncbi:MAG: TonB dependent receptor [Bacteroidetes bacterium]|nr:TonB dependent receptor [Bacteroidota bacterium]